MSRVDRRGDGGAGRGPRLLRRRTDHEIWSKYRASEVQLLAALDEAKPDILAEEPGAANEIVGIASIVGQMAQVLPAPYGTQVGVYVAAVTTYREGR